MTTISESVKGDSKEPEAPVVRQPANPTTMWNRLDVERAMFAIDQLEQAPNALRAEGTLPFRFNFKEFERVCQKQRQKARMLLLKTGAINSDIRAAKARLEAKPSDWKAKEDLRRCFNAVGWHKEDSEAYRILLKIPAQTNYMTVGQTEDIAVEPLEDTSLNDLERRYYDDRVVRERPHFDRPIALWPFEQCEKDFGVGYKGWLRWKFENGLLPLADYVQEKARLYGD